MKFICKQCGKKEDRPTGIVNRALRVSGYVFCNRTCAGLHRRHNRTKEESVRLKAEYDKKYRENNADLLKIKKHQYFKKTYDPAKAAIERKKKMPKHVEYCRQPEYRTKKKEYDVVHLAKKNYGYFWESALLIRKIQAEYDDEEIRQINNLHNKKLKRKRKWNQLKKLNYLQAT